MIGLKRRKRISIIISPQDKEIIERAAQHKGLSISSYIVSTILKQAKNDIGDNGISHT